MLLVHDEIINADKTETGTRVLIKIHVPVVLVFRYTHVVTLARWERYQHWPHQPRIKSNRTKPQRPPHSSQLNSMCLLPSLPSDTHIVTLARWEGTNTGLISQGSKAIELHVVTHVVK